LKICAAEGNEVQESFEIPKLELKFLEKNKMEAKTPLDFIEHSN
jgi:hypothetical protein